MQLNLVCTFVAPFSSLLGDEGALHDSNKQMFWPERLVTQPVFYKPKPSFFLNRNQNSIMKSSSQKQQADSSFYSPRLPFYHLEL